MANRTAARTVTPELRTARATRDELMRQLVLERRFDVVVDTHKGKAPKIPKAVARAFTGFEFGVVSMPGLQELQRVADRVLLRADGIVFNVALLTIVGEQGGLSERLELDELVRIGERFTDRTGRIHGTRLPVAFQLFEIFPAGIAEGFTRQISEYARRGISAPKIGVGVVAIDAQRGRTWSNYPGLVRWSHVALARRAWKERDLPGEARAARLARSGFQFEKAALGIGAGAFFGIAATHFLLEAAVERGELFGGAVVMASLVASVVSLKSCRVVHATVPQSAVAGVIAAIAVLAAGHAMGLGLGLGAAMTLLAALVVSFALGLVDNPQGRTR